MFETKIIRPNIPAGHRVFVTSDLHGHGHYLKNLLERVHFSQDDYLIVAGDMLEKGPDSLGTLRYILALSQQGNVYPLMGNVDAFALSHIVGIHEDIAEDVWAIVDHWYRWWGSTLFHEMAKELHLPLTCPADAVACREPFMQHFSKELAFLENLPTILETENYVFVHGGLKEKEPAANDCHSMFSLTKYDDFIGSTPHVFSKTVIVGHWPVILYRDNIPCHEPYFCEEKNIFSIDGGCGIKEDGQLNLLCLPDIHCSAKDITWERFDELPVVTALENQAASNDSISINWHTRHLMILERGDEFTHIRHLHSGRELDIPTAYLYRDTECRDYTDYHLPVQPGDRLSVTHKTSRGIIVKKDGVVGWYFGAYK